jgi:hypothetical protein
MATGLDGRHRDQNGQIERKKGNTKLGTLREEYGEDLAPGIRSDAKLENVLDRLGYDSLSELLRRSRR